MATTPEGKVKRAVSKILTEFGCYYDMPVPGGFGGVTLDYVGCHYGYFFAIETKAPGKKPTERQKMTINMMQRAGAQVFVIDGTGDELLPLEEWLDMIRRNNRG